MCGGLYIGGTASLIPISPQTDAPIKGNRIVLFAPVYLANFCVNSCTYCAFRGANKGMERSMLTMDELRCALSSWSCVCGGGARMYTMSYHLLKITHIHTRPCPNSYSLQPKTGRRWRPWRRSGTSGCCS